jgi:hypothetical protein
LNLLDIHFFNKDKSALDSAAAEEEQGRYPIRFETLKEYYYPDIYKQLYPRELS